MTTKHKFYLLGFCCLAILTQVALQIERVAKSIPQLDGSFNLEGLEQPVEVHFDASGIPTVMAKTRDDAYRSLGLIHARDRLFQMDVARRKMSGRLSEVFGKKALEMDKTQRVFQFDSAAHRIFQHLPRDQQDLLEAYTEGVNASLINSKSLPFEFLALKYQPESWKPTDSILVALVMFQTLSDQEKDERMLTVMKRALPEDLFKFLTPDSDPYTKTLLGGNTSRRPEASIPTESILKIISKQKSPEQSLTNIDEDTISLGSNNWVVSGKRTQNNRAILANDMHLPLNVPNTWYRAKLSYETSHLSGLTLPGLPLVVAGSNTHIAWGFTNVDGDFLDLVSLKLDKEHPGRYRTSAGWKELESHEESIKVKDEPTVKITVRSTIWGPLSEVPLIGNPVAIHWSALDPEAVNLNMVNMDQAETLLSAIDIMNRSGSPPQNVVLADELGHIAWTYMGAYPKRMGMDGSVSEDWSNPQRGWNHYIEPKELPRVIDPPDGILVTANNRTLGKNYTYPIGHSFSHSYRAYRIRQLLEEKPNMDEKDMLEIQLDTRSEPFDYYRDLALSILHDEDLNSDPDMLDAEASIAQWDGHMNPSSTGIALLIEWKALLSKSVLSPLMKQCENTAPDFTYRWKQYETPLRSLISERDERTISKSIAMNWNQLLISTLRTSVETLKSKAHVVSIRDLRLADVNKVRIEHPFSQKMPIASHLLDMPEIDGACNSMCIKVLTGKNGASERMVISPSHESMAILQMPAGQSGHPFSRNYRDQQDSWASGAPTPFEPSKTEHVLNLIPMNNRSKQ